MTHRFVVLLLALGLVATACGGEDGTDSSSTSDAQQGSGTTQAVDAAEYCAALEEMFGAQPAGGFFGDGFAVAMNTYADAIDDAAGLAPEEQSDALSNLAAFVRDSATNPNDEGLADRAFGLVAPMLRVQNYAVDDCGIDEETLTGGSSEPPPPVREDVAAVDDAALDAANDLVPGGVDLEFESLPTADDDGEYPVLAAAPVGWDARAFIGTTFEPGEDFGFFTKMDLGAHCDGICAPRDWGSLVNDPEFGPFAALADALEVLRDEELTAPQGRIAVYREDSTITPINIVVARWDDRADRYFRCEVGLDEDDVDLWPAFAAACEASIPLWIPAS